MLGSFIRNPITGAAGWTIIHSIWQAATIAAMLALVLLVARSSRLRYGAACTAMLLQVITCGVTFIYLVPLNQSPVVITARAGVSLATPASALPTSIVWSLGLNSLAPWFTFAWVVGAFVFYAISAVGLLSVRRLRKRGVCCADPMWQSRLNAIRQKLRMRRAVQLLESCFAETPMVIGHFRPVILVPIGMLTGFPAVQVEVILTHELAHILRRDYLINALQRVVEGLFFYHPAIWWISGVIRAERENCCDDIAVAAGADVREYAAVLAALEEKRLGAFAPALTMTGGSLMKRIQRLLYPQTPRAAWSPLLAAGICILLLSFGLGAWQSDTGNPSTAQFQRLQEFAMFLANSLASNNAYAFADDAERAAYLRLGTDEERHSFLKQFWLRRNPGINEQELHQVIGKRLAFADQHFQTSTAFTGSQTDRGRMYVLYGPPDEIDSHPVEGREEWRYSRFQGPSGPITFTFVEKAGTGEYRLSQPQNPRG